MTTHALRKEAAKAVVDRAVRRVLKAAGRRSPQRIALERLLRRVRGRPDFFRPAHAGAAAEVADGLLALAWFYKEWLRPAEAWTPPESNPLPRFSSLAHHLLAEYPVPPVVLSAWFRGQDGIARRWQRMFLHLGRGKNLRTAYTALTLTRRMAHEFGLAPAHLSIEQALRLAEVVALGGSPELAEAVAATSLGRHFRRDEFWRTVFLLFIRTRRFDLAQVDPIVRDIHRRKFASRTVEVADGVSVELEPEEPAFSVKGRTVASLLRDAAERRRRPAVPVGADDLRWPRCAIGEYRTEDEAHARDIRQLLSAADLAREGTAMHNCVAEYYVSPCLSGESSIWSLGTDEAGDRKRELTIEVNPASRTIVQALRCCNEPANDGDKAVIRAWAQREGLSGVDDL